MGEADRIVEAREQERHSAAARRKALETRSALERKESLVRSVADEIPGALERLERAGFPGGQMVAARQRGRFGRTRVARCAGWRVHSWTYIAEPSGRGEHEAHNTVWLLSGGTLAIGDEPLAPFDLEWFAEHDAALCREVLGGLQSLGV